MKEIHKVGAIVIKENAFLMVRKTGKDIWTNLGGHIEEGESEEEALVREIREEVGADGKIIKKLGDFIAPAAHDQANVKLSGYLVEIEGELKITDPELEEIRFISNNYMEQGIKLPLSITEKVLPFLIENNYLQWV
jgi:8-oxo-dGTP diphosphatase